MRRRVDRLICLVPWWSLKVSCRIMYIHSEKYSIRERKIVRLSPCAPYYKQNTTSNDLFRLISPSWTEPVPLARGGLCGLSPSSQGLAMQRLEAFHVPYRSLWNNRDRQLNVSLDLLLDCRNERLKFLVLMKGEYIVDGGLREGPVDGF